MSIGRGAHVAARLPDGRVPVAGGWDGAEFLASAEIWDPATGVFSPTASMSAPRAAAATAVLSDGRVLVTGGQDDAERGRADAEAYAPDGRWSPAGELAEPRFKHAAVRSCEDVLLIAGTSDDRDLLRVVERFDTSTGTFADAGELRQDRYKLPDAVVALADERVLVGGGGAGAELFDPRSGHSVELDSGPWRSFATATLVGPDVALVVGGYDRRIDLVPGAVLVTFR